MELFSGIILFSVIHYCFAYDALMVAGGYYHEGGEDVFLNEIIGKHNSCEIAPLPEPRLGFTLTRLKRTVVACGGFHIYERSDCFTYFPRLGRWVHNTDMQNGSSVFHAAAGEGNRMYLVGGRRFMHDLNQWKFSDTVWRYEGRRRKWRRMVNMRRAMADGCLVVFNGDLMFLGGSKGKYMYAYDPSRISILAKGEREWNSTILPEMLGNRMWHACTVTNIGGELGLVVAGGYYDGQTSMFLPLPPSPTSSWRWLGKLPFQRKWGPALGTIDGVLTIAGGKNYGDDTIDELVTSATGDPEWRGPLPDRRMLHKREFSAHATVPTQWFPHCNF